MKLIVSLYHYRLDPETQDKLYDNEEQFIFEYDGSILSIQGTSWKKQCTKEEVFDAIDGYFKGTNYVLANIQKMLE